MKFKVAMMTPSFDGGELAYIKDALENNEISVGGRNSDIFLNMILSYLDMPYGHLVSNGTAALHLSLKALDVSEGDIVFCPTFTYCGTAYPIIYERAVPVFLDCKEDGTISEEILAAALHKYKESLPKAVMVVDTYGASADYDKIEDTLKSYEIPIISDSAESLGGEYKGRKCGTYGNVSAISFSYSKIITTSLGGVILSHDEGIIKKAAYLSNQAKAKSPQYIHREIGYNYGFSNILAGLGIHSMERIDYLLKRKSEIFKRYRNGITDAAQFVSDKPGSAHWQNGVILKDMDVHSLIPALLHKGIEVRCGFNPMHRQEAFAGFDYITDKDVSAKLFNETILLPSGAGMTDSQQDYVIETLNTLIKSGVYAK